MKISYKDIYIDSYITFSMPKKNYNFSRRPRDRLVTLSVTPLVRKKIKKLKGGMSYSDFLYLVCTYLDHKRRIEIYFRGLRIIGENSITQTKIKISESKCNSILRRIVDASLNSIDNSPR